MPGTSSARPKPRWRMLWWIVALAVIAQIVAWNAVDGDVVKQGLNTWLVGLATAALLLLWWVFFSRLPWKVRLFGLAGLGLAFGAFLGVFRYEGLAGDFSPIFTLRHQASAEARALEYSEARGGVDGAVAEVEPLVAGPSDWPGFRGPSRDGKALGEVVRTDWARKPPRLLWRHAVGPAWASFALVGDMLFTQEQRGDAEAVVAYRVRTGEEVWAHTNEGRHETPLGGIGPRATPTFHDSRLYALGATGVLDCLEPRTGRLLWSRDILADAGTQPLDFGYAGSPLVYDDVVVVEPGKNVPQGGDRAIYDGTPPGALIAYDRLTGEIAWRAGGRQAGYTAPRLETIHGHRQLLIFSAFGVGGHDPADGRELWWSDWKNPYGTNSVQPIVLADDSVFISTEQTGSTLLDLDPLTDPWTVSKRWETPRYKLRYNGGVERDGTIYGLNAGVLSALDPETGERLWKQGRYKFGQVLLLRDHLLVLAESGMVALVDVSPEGMTELASFQAIEGRCWNHPVLRDGVLCVRSDEEAACYDLR